MLVLRMYIIYRHYRVLVLSSVSSLNAVVTKLTESDWDIRLPLMNYNQTRQIKSIQKRALRIIFNSNLLH